ncbi:hypothetical protein, partial [Micromonospora arida]
MSQYDGSIYVDPDGVTKAGGLYGEHATTYAGYLAYIEAVRSHYGSSWGSDEMGRKFAESFLKGMNALELIIKGTVGMLQYTSDGLLAGGKEYRAADEDALAAGRKLLGLSEEYPATGGSGTKGTPSGTKGTPSGTVTPATLRSGMTAATPHTPAKPAMLASGGGKTTTADLPIGTAATPQTPAFSAYDTRDLSGTHVAGQPLSDGQRLVAFVPLPDGTVQVDANLYESLTPVASSAVTG